jgi:membrane protease YdiL (CAAX protease family)
VKTSTLLPPLWCFAATILTIFALRTLPTEVIVFGTVLSCAAAIVLTFSVTRHVPDSHATRLLAYGCAFVANQAAAVTCSVIALLPGRTLTPETFTSADIVYALGSAGLAVWTFLLVRAWVSSEPTRVDTDDPRSRITKLMVGSAGAGAALLMMFAAGIVRFQLVAALDLTSGGYPVELGGVDQWLMTTFIAAAAGVVEEPVFVGVAVLLWPRGSRHNILIAAIVSTIARTSIHLYYANGAADVVKAVIVVFLWCAIWSGFNLLVVYRTRMLWPVIVSHILQNAVMVAALPWAMTEPLSPLQELAAAAMGVALTATLFAIVVGSVAYVIGRAVAVTARVRRARTVTSRQF